MQREMGMVLRNKKNEKAILLTLTHMKREIRLMGVIIRMRRL